MNRELDALCARFNGFSLAGWVLLVLMSATSAHAAIYTVTNTDPSGPGSLLQAILDADGTPADDVIVFDSSLGDVTITPDSTLGISSSDGGALRIDGDGRVTVSGGNSRSVFINGSDSFLTINGLTITGGNDVNGGGIFNRGTLVLNDSTITGNVATSIGGGILNATTGAELTLNRTVVTNNSAPEGGGIRNESTLVLNNSTIAANLASASGSGIFNFGTLTLNNATVSGVPLSSDTGLYVAAGTVTINNSILANNGGGDCLRNAGTINASHSLIESGFGCVNGINTNNLTIDPALGALTGSPAYYSLLATSPAIDAGNNTLIPAEIATDQAGNARIVNSTVDMGAVEFQGADLSVTVTDTPDPVEVGERVDYSVEVANAGPYPASNVVLTIAVPAGRTLNLTDGAGWLCSLQIGNNYVCGTAELLQNESDTLAFWLTAPDDPGSLTLGASVTSDITDPDASNNTASATTTVVTVPGAPLITGVTAGDGQLTVAFTAGADNGATITNYEYSLDGGLFVPFNPATTTSPVVIGGLSNGTSYAVRLRAVNSVGAGAASNSVEGTPVTVPGAPTDVMATPGNAEADVDWTAPADDGGSTITGYTVTSSPDNEICTTTGATSCTVSGLTNGTDYTFTVIASNDAGDSPPSSASSPITPAGIPGAPLQVQVSPGVLSLTVSWVASTDNGGSPILRYRAEANPTCEVDAQVDEVAGVTAYSCTISNLDPSREYTVTVVAINAIGESPGAAAAASARPLPPLPIPLFDRWGLMALILVMLALPALVRRSTA